MRSDEEIIAELKIATEGFLLMSEGDYPVKVIKWDGQTAITPEYLRGISGVPADSEIYETEVDNFYRANAKFQEVVRLLKSNLTDPKVYKVGLINIPVYRGP